MAGEPRFKGVVKRFNDARGFGFILPNDGGDELFVHHSSIASDGYRTLAVGDEVDFSIRKATNGQYQAFDVVGPNAPALRSNGDSRGAASAPAPAPAAAICYNCGGSGHIAKNCNQKQQNAGGGIDRGSGTCFNCGELGHMVKDCPKGNSKGSGGGDRACFKCGEAGHMAKDCSNGETERPVRVGGGGKCHNCGEEGHFARNCRNQESGGGSSRSIQRTCFTCGKSGHFARECPQAAF